MNLKILFAILAVALVAIIALNWILLVGLSKSASCKPSKFTELLEEVYGETSQGMVFADLDSEELTSVVQYLKLQLGVKLVSCAEALPSDNYIHMIELQLPRKSEVLKFLDSVANQPKREARAVVIFGEQSEPNITEYVVGPLPNPTYHKDITSQKYQNLSFHSRPVTSFEHKKILLRMGLEKASRLLLQSFGSDWEDLIHLDSAPRGFKTGDRETWFPFLRNVSGVFMHPLGFEVLIDHSSRNISEWKVKQIFYNGQYFDSIEQLITQYDRGAVKKIRLHREQSDPNYASLKPHMKHHSVSPLQYEPQGRRYSVAHNHVRYFNWKFAFRHSTVNGLQLFNIRFMEERIAYELSVEELNSVYGGDSPSLMRTKFLDQHYSIGRSANELVRGVDCPYTAVFVDTVHFTESEKPGQIRNSICIFELNKQIPLRRHFSSWYTAPSYGAVADCVLIIRSISTVANYDYVFDYIFHHNGVIETKVHPSGYALTSILSESGLKYGAKLEENLLGNIHTHFLHFKADVDVAGRLQRTSNSIETKDVEYELKSAPWKNDQKIHVPVVKEQILGTENQAAFRAGTKMPRYLSFVNLHQRNNWNHYRGYRIQVVSFNPDSIPEEIPEEKAISWQRYQLAVTKYKEKEQRSSSMYNQNNPWNPAVYFAGFIDDEDIQNEDLVAWITAGFLHIPHSEDVPNTATAGNGIGFYLKPINYFLNDPSVNAEDAVYIDTSEDAERCENNPVACTPEYATCIPKFPDFTYGTD
ncbi:retina-specific copper amine oxidase isoform X1 [Stegostoma tigrinum]|uniref:retina-specific copper amine oxidase isoform X1 n=1 Tax=Stegostoma tigrinum TaxID=3053191 RepID=UPI00202B7294|nr:retina-specific copper amine oxidase isoform X1 [Stegostoma tigrinum]